MSDPTQHEQPTAEQPARSGRVRAAAGISGVLVYVAFFGLDQTDTGLTVAYVPPFTYSTAGEVYFWLGHALLLFPAACLIGFSCWPWIAGLNERAGTFVQSLSRRAELLGLFALWLGFAALFRAGRALVLRDQPFTDDEFAVRFGGQVLALGKAMIPVPAEFPAYPRLFLFTRDGWVTSFDWLGGQLAWAIGELSGLGPACFALAAAIPIPCLALILRNRLGREWGLVACAVAAFSPMALSISFSTHTHLLSRACLALALCSWVFAEQRDRLALWGLTGLFVGLGFLCRPIEISVLFAPFALLLLVRLYRGNAASRRALMGLFLGLVLPLLTFMLHNWLLTGDPLFPARFSPDVFSWSDNRQIERVLSAASFWKRFGANTSYNLLMLAIWFLGPLGVALVAAGANTDQFTRLSGAGVAALLLLGVAHDDYGLHVVGPIHYSECAVPLTIIAVHGLANLLHRIRESRLNPGVAAGIFTFALVLGLGTFNTWNALALRRQAGIHSHIYGFIEGSVAHNAVVLAPQYMHVWRNIPEFRQIGSWVFEWRRPRPDLSDDVLILHDLPGAYPELRKRFPDRSFYRLRVKAKLPYLILEPLS